MIVDDNADVLQTPVDVLNQAGHQAARLQPHIAVLDIGLPDINEFDLA